MPQHGLDGQFMKGLFEHLGEEADGLGSGDSQMKSKLDEIRDLTKSENAK